MASPHETNHDDEKSSDNANAGTPIGEPSNSNNNLGGKKGVNRRKALLASLIGLALLSLLVLLGNPGLLIPPNEGDDGTAEATDDNTSDDNLNTDDNVNTTESGSMISEIAVMTNETDDNGSSGQSSDGNGGFVIISPGINVTGSSGSDGSSGGGGGSGGCGGGGGGGRRG